MENDNIFENFEYKGSRAKVMVSDLLFIKEIIAITLGPPWTDWMLHHSKVLYNFILNKFEFECFRAKVKVTAVNCLFHLILSHNFEGCRRPTDEFASIPFHLVMFSAALVKLTKSIPV